MHNAAFAELGLNWRYLAFEVYERKKLTDTHLKMQDSSSIDGANPFDAAVDQLKADYGNDFARDCGWAASVLKKKRVCFTDIENATEFSSARLYYEQASKAVHASSLGMNYRPSMDHVVENGDQLEFAVATNVGLVTPAMLSAWSLMCITLTLLSSSTNVDRLVAMHFLRRFEPEVRRKFHAAENRIAKREKNKKINKLPRSKLHGIQE